MNESPTFLRLREEHSPLFEVYIGRAKSGREMIYLGGIRERERYEEALGEWFDLERIPVSSRPAPALVEWIKSGPAELNRAMEADLPGDIGRTVGITETYFETEEVRVR